MGTIATGPLPGHQAEVRASAEHAHAAPGELGADWIMVMLVNAELTELEIRYPSHPARSRGRCFAGGRRGDDPVRARSRSSPRSSRRRSPSDAPPPSVTRLVLPHGDAVLLIGDRDVLAAICSAANEPAVRELDLAALHVALLGDRLGISAADVAGGTRLAYTRDEADALARVASGQAAAAILVRPTRLEQLADVATAGDVMPQKSTYFYPKLLTGMAFYSLED